MICPKCNATVDDSALFCPYCASELAQPAPSPDPATAGQTPNPAPQEAAPHTEPGELCPHCGSYHTKLVSQEMGYNPSIRPIANFSKGGLVACAFLLIPAAQIAIPAAIVLVGILVYASKHKCMVGSWLCDTCGKVFWKAL